MTRFSPRHASATSLMALSIAGLLVTVSGTAQAAGATAVPLGTATGFAILAESGITNTGVTTITGDVGSYPTPSETGFGSCTSSADCVVLTGANHTTADQATNTANSDMDAAFGNAAGQSSTSVATELANTSLVAGVYRSPTLGMTGTLTLNGANDPNSVWIFQAGSTLITAANANVNLVNGAQACNVFWEIGSSATLGTGSSIVGTIMANDDISLADSVTVNGRLFAGAQNNGAGAVTLIHDTIIQSACVTAVTPPPVKATATATPKPSSTPKASATPSTAAASASAAAASKSAAAAKVAAAAKAAAAGAGGAFAPAGPQILRVPVGAVHTGDGSSIRHNDGNMPPVMVAGFVIVGLGVTASSVARRRRRRS